MFEKYFKIRHLVAKMSLSGLDYRRRYPDKWRLLLEAGVAEEDLLLKGLAVVLQKPGEGCC